MSSDIRFPDIQLPDRNDPFYKAIRTEVVKDVLWILQTADWDGIFKRDEDGNYVENARGMREYYYRAKDVLQTIDVIREYGDIKED